MEFEDFYDVAVDLLDNLKGRLSDEWQDIYRSMAWAGEEGLMIDMLAGDLAERNVPLTSAEAAQCANLLRVFDLDQVDRIRFQTLHDRERVIGSLNIVDPLSGP